MEGKIERGTRAFLHTNLALFAAGLATFALLYCVQPLMPVFSAAFGVGAAGASLSLSLSTGLLAVSLLVAGLLSEVWGRKPVMVASLLLSAGLTIVCAVLPQWWMLLTVRALTGIALSGVPAVAMAYLGEEMQSRSLGLAMGLYVGGTGLGGLAGRLLTGVITEACGWRVAVAAMGLLGLACAATLWRSLPASRHFVRREPRLASLVQVFGAHLRDPVLPLLYAEGFLLMGGFVTVYNYVSYRLMAPPYSLSQAGVGLIFSVYLLGVAGSAWAGALSERHGRSTLLPVTLVLVLAGMLLTLSARLWLIVAGMAVLTLGFFGSHSLASAWVGARARIGKAQASSLYLFAYYVGSSVVGSLGGFFWSWGAWPAVIAVTGLLTVVAILVALRLRFADAGGA